MINDFTSALPHVNSAIKLKESTELFFYKAICLRELKNKDSSEYYLLKCIKDGKNIYNENEQYVETEDKELPDNYTEFQEKVDKFFKDKKSDFYFKS